MATHTTPVKRPSPSGLTHGFDRSNIEDALNSALHHIRNAHDAASIQAATGKAQRAATLLKRACEDARLNRT